MKFDIGKKNILTLCKFYIIFTLIMSLVNINEGFGMEEAKDSLANALVSLQESIESKKDIKAEQIKDYLECSESFLKEYFGMQKFTDIFFSDSGPYGYGIYRVLEKQINLIKDDTLRLQRTTLLVNSAHRSMQKISKINNLINASLNSAFNGSTCELLINNILDQGIYNQETILDDVDKQVNKGFSPIIMALSFIRESSDNDIFLNSINFNEKKQIRNRTINEKETILKSLNLIKLNEKMSKVFLNSKRLMFQQVSQQLLKTYGIDIFAAKNLYVDYISETDSCRYMTFKYNNHIYKVQQQEKSGGVNFGFVLNIYKNANINELETTKKQSNFELDKNDELIGRFFIKKYHKGTIYTKANNVDSAHSLGTKIPSMTSTSFATSQTEDSKSVVNKRESERFLDLKEPFIYKVLEQLKLGPEVHFTINPYINRGFYIATKDISGDGYFSTIGSMEKKIEIELSGENKFLKNITEENIKNLSIGLSELNLFGLIYSLEDLNTGNYGHIFANEKDSEDYNQDIIDTKNFKIIDFAPPCYKENKKDRIPFNEKYEFKQNIKNILNKYYRIKFNENRFMGLLKEQIVDIDIMKLALSQFEERLQKLNVPYKEDIEDYVGDNFGSGSDNEVIKKLRQVSQRTAQYMKDLINVQRGENEDEIMLRHPTEIIKVDDVLRKRNRTNAELIGFKIGDIPDDIKKDSKEQLQYLNNALTDLTTYSESIISNYRELKEYVNKEYNQYFDENGKLISEVEQQDQLSTPPPLL